LLGFDLQPVVENTVNSAKFTYALKDSFSIRSPQPIALMMMRDRFDQFLVEKALGVGAEFVEGEKVVGVEEKDKRVEVTFARGEKVQCDYLIGADGAGSAVAKLLSSSQPKGSADGAGLESVLPLESTTGFPKEELQMMHFDFGEVPYGYGWVFPKGKWLSIGIGGVFKGSKSKLRAHFNTLLEGLPFTSEGGPGKVHGHPVPSFYSLEQKVSRGRILLVGDAAHLIDPLTGEGIYYAIRSGLLASEAILGSKNDGRDVSADYQRTVEGFLYEDLKWALNLSRFIYRSTKLAYQTFRHYPELGILYIQVLEGKETYQGFVARVKERAREVLKGKLKEKIKKLWVNP
jgi:geranylgeranyl reductase family protein